MLRYPKKWASGSRKENTRHAMHCSPSQSWQHSPTLLFPLCQHLASRSSSCGWSPAIDQSWHLYHAGFIFLQLTKNSTQGNILAHGVRIQGGFGFKHTEVRTSTSQFCLLSCQFHSKVYMGAPSYSIPLLSWRQISQKRVSASPKAQTKVLEWTQLTLFELISVTCLSLN